MFPPVVSSGPFETIRFRDPFKASLQDEAFFLALRGVIKQLTQKRSKPNTGAGSQGVA